MITTGVAFDADRSNGQQPARIAARHRSRRLRTKATDGQAGPGKRMPVEKLGGNAQLFADLANFIFIKPRQRLDDAARVDQLLNSGDAIVMGLDHVGLRGAAGFDGVGINGALPQDPIPAEKLSAAPYSFLHHDELPADDVPLGLWIDDAFESFQKFG